MSHDSSLIITFILYCLATMRVRQHQHQILMQFQAVKLLRKIFAINNENMCLEKYTQFKI